MKEKEIFCRPISSSGRPISGVLRPETHARPGTMEQALRTSRTSRTTRATSSSSARFTRLGTVSNCTNQSNCTNHNQILKIYNFK